MYQASGTQLFWYQRSLEPDRPAELFLGPIELQGSLERDSGRKGQPQVEVNGHCGGNQDRGSIRRYLSKDHKAGLVGPAFPLWNWFVGLVWIG